jgi:GT2 family glycosyltransferase
MLSITPIIVDHHRPDLLVHCLRSIRAQTWQPDCRVLVGHSPDAESEQIARDHMAHPIEYPESNGFASTATDLARLAAIENPKGMILLLGNDITLHPEFFHGLLKPSEDGLDVLRMIQGPALFEHGKYVGGGANWSRLFLVPIVLPAHQFISRHVDFVSGNCMAIPSRYILDYGLFDCTLWSYAEDIELCMRARRLGYQIYANVFCEASHEPNNAFSRVPAKRYYYSVRNLVRVVRRYRWGCYPINLMLFTLVLLACNVRRRGSFKPAWRGYIDGWREKLP